MAADDTPADGISPDCGDAEIDANFVQALTRIDESLRLGRSTINSGGGRDDDDVAAARTCLTLLERFFPRTKTDEPKPAVQHIGRFEVRRVLGQGGFGIVYLAYDPKLERLVAVKVPQLHVIGSSRQQERFLREARAVAALEHPFIASILESGEAGPICFTACAYCEGGDLKDWLQKNGPVESRTAAKIVAALASAVEYSHRKGILHCDIKPSNVLLTSRHMASGDEDDLPFAPRLSDFGLARMLEAEPAATASGLIGSPLYMAPEQTVGGGKNVGPATDIYALGVTLYELLTGRPPFQGASALEILDQVRTADPVSPRSLIRSVARDLEVICLTCLAKEPARRYGSVGLLQADLNAFLEGRVITARPAGRLEISLKWMRRHPLAGALVSFAVLAICAIILLQRWHVSELDEHVTRAVSLQKQAETLRAQAEVGEIEVLVRQSVSEINSASLDLYSGNFKQAERRLAPVREAIGRGLTPILGVEPEWNYVRRQLESPSPERVFSGHGRPVFSVAVAPDGRFVASGDDRGTVKIWELLTGREITTLSACEGEVRALTFSPDGKRLASGGMFHHLKIWETRNWQVVNSLDAHDGTITCLAWQNADRFLASGGRDGRLRLWNTSDLTLLQEIDVGAVIHCVRVPGDGSSIWTTDKTHRVSRWSLEGTQAIRHDLMMAPADPRALDISDDGQFAVLGCGFLAPTGRFLFPFFSPSADAAVITQTGRWSAVAGNHGCVSLWRWSDDPFSSISQQQWAAHPGHTMYSFAAAPDGARLVTAGLDGLVKVWRVDGFTMPDRQWLAGHADGVGGLAFSADDRLVVSAGTDGRIRVYECQSGHLIDALDFERQGYGFAELGFGSDGETLVVKGSRRGVGTGILFWRPGSGVPPTFVANPGMLAKCLSPDGARLIAVLDEKRGVQLWDTTQRQLIRTFDLPFVFHRVRIAANGRIAALWSQDRYALHLLDMETGSLRQILSCRAEKIEFDSTGSRLVVVGSDSTLTIVDVHSGGVIESLGTTGTAPVPDSSCFSPDGNILAVSFLRHDEQRGHVEIWHLETRRPILTLEPFALRPGNICYSHSGRYLATVTPAPDSNGNAGILLWQFDPARGQSPVGKSSPAAKTVSSNCLNE